MLAHHLVQHGLVGLTGTILGWQRRAGRAEVLLEVDRPGDFGLVYPFTGRWLAFTNAMVRRKPEQFLWALKTLDDVGGYEDGRHRRIRAMGIRHVYVGHWPRKDLVIPPPGRRIDASALAENPWLTRVHASPTSQIYRLLERPDPSSTLVNLPIDGPPAGFDGLHEVEEERETRFRWTAGHARIQIPAEVVPSRAGCRLHLGLGRLNPVTVRWDGRALRERCTGVFPLPGTHRLELDSSTFVPREVEPGSRDGRTLGLFIDQISLACAPGGTRVLPLAGNDQVTYSGFYPVERFGDAPHRWTNGRGRVRIARSYLAAGETCHLAIRYNRPPDGPVELRWDGERLLPEADGRYRLPQRTQHLLELLSPTRQAGRTLGVALKRMRIVCPRQQ